MAPARRALLAAALLAAAVLLPGAARHGGAAAPPAVLAEARFAFLVPGPGGPFILEVAAVAPAVAPADAAALASAIRAANPGAVPLPPRSASAAYVLDGVRWRDPVVPWYYAPAGATPSLPPGDAFERIRRAAESWSGAGGTPVRFDYRGETTDSPGCRGDPAAITYTADGRNVLGWDAIPGNYLGYTCWMRSASLVEGTPYFELIEFDIVLDPRYPYTGDILQALALHEFGHALGLGHSDRCPGAAMCAGELALIFTEPQPDDLAALIALYGRRPPTPLPRRALVPAIARD